MIMTIKLLLLGLLCVIQYGNARDCTSQDVKKFQMDCNSKGIRKVVSYLDSSLCDLKDTNLIKPYTIPCTCPPGQGLSEGSKPTCRSCEKGYYSAGGEDISDWHNWSNNGTLPPSGSDIVTFCETYRSYVKPCERWKTSFFKDVLESGDNSPTRCLSSVMIIRKTFVGQDNYIKFTYRVEGRQCYNNYVGCDGLSFYVDNTQVMKAEGNVFMWKQVRFNVSAGYHELKFVYRKNCYSFPTPGIADKAFVQSITLVGTLEPNTKCKPCPPGTYSTETGAKQCTKCDYFQEQPDQGKQRCTPCGKDSYSMPGSPFCIPKINCTNDDLIMAPEPLSSCSKVSDKDGFITKVTPEYVTVRIQNKPHVLCAYGRTAPLPKNIPCRCQPGYEFIPETKSCRACPKGQMSRDGLKCQTCPNGHVALMGKHYYWWAKGPLPTGFSSGCAGDCPGDKEKGWIPSGNYIRTSRVVGNVDSYLQSDKYVVSSNIAYIAFNCSILCNISQPTSIIKGHHLASIQYCNLVFEVWSNNSVIDRVNCTRPKGKYVYRHERYRDGTLVSHSYRLKKGSYQFRWVFNQEDETRAVSAAFEAKVYNISIVGVQGGSAKSCTPCFPGFKSVLGNTDCSVCPKGTFSGSAANTCTQCREGYFADTPGSGECLSCGATTTSLPRRDGCTNNDCKFVVEKGHIEYDFSRLSRVNGTMFTVLNYQVDIAHGPEALSRGAQRRPSGSMRRLSVWPHYRPRLYLNLCTVEHDNSSCTSRTSQFGPRKSRPVMGCSSSWWSRQDTSIGRVIGFEAKKDPASGVIVHLLHGDICARRKSGNLRFNSTIDLTCDVDAGIGNPGPQNNHTNIFRPPCLYYFKWNSLYACPKCRKGDLEKVTHPCINGTYRVTYSRKVPCWGSVDGMEAGETVHNCTDSPTNFHKVKRILRVQQTINKVLIGVGVVVIVALLIVAGYYFYKHRDFKYKYYGTLARNKPMSKLEEEEEDFGHVEGDMFNDTRRIFNS